MICQMRMDGKSLAAYRVNLTVLELLPPDIRTGVYFLTGLDAKCVIKHNCWPGSSPFLSLFGALTGLL